MPSATLFHQTGGSAIIRGGKNSFRLPLFKRWLPTSVLAHLQDIVADAGFMAQPCQLDCRGGVLRVDGHTTPKWSRFYNPRPGIQCCLDPIEV
jgi:hypothetical protein